MTITVYGIPNCNSVKKAKTWLDQHKINYHFTDLKKAPPSLNELKKWISVLGLEQIINKKSTTWRTLDNSIKILFNHEDTAINIIMQNLSIIKRPLIIWQDQSMTVGFNETIFLNKISI